MTTGGSPSYEKLLTLSDYLFGLFQSQIFGKTFPPIPTSLPMEDAKECQRMACALGKAFKNKSELLLLILHLTLTHFGVVVLSWSVEDYMANLPPKPKGFSSPTEDYLEEKFPPVFQPPYRHVNEPCIVVDCNGVILLWYLPDLLSSLRQVTVVFYKMPGLIDWQPYLASFLDRRC